jgi:LPXTG-motif cell wall-anchored protein
VFWQVGSSATFGTGSHLSGQVLALQSITATTGATFDGQLLAPNGAVTLDTNTIVNDACAAVVTPEPPTEDGPDDVIPDVATPEPEPAPVPAPESHTVDGGTLPETDAIQWVATLALGAGVLALATTALIRSRKRS